MRSKETLDEEVGSVRGEHLTDPAIKKLWSILYQSFYYEVSKTAFRIENAYYVNIKNLEEKYKSNCNKQRIMSKAEDVEEVYLFAEVADDHLNSILIDGIQCGNVKYCMLGKIEKGVSLNRCADILDEVRLKRSRILDGERPEQNLGRVLIVFKVTLTLSKLKKVRLDHSLANVDPYPGYIGHFSAEWANFKKYRKLSPTHESLVDAYRLFYAAQYLLYDFDHRRHYVQPQNILPYAVVKFNYIVPPFSLHHSLNTKSFENILWKGKMTGSGTPDQLEVCLSSQNFFIMPIRNLDGLIVRAFQLNVVLKDYFSFIPSAVNGILKTNEVLKCDRIAYMRMSHQGNDGEALKRLIKNWSDNTKAAVIGHPSCEVIVLMPSCSATTELDHVKPHFGRQTQLHCFVIFHVQNNRYDREKSLINWRTPGNHKQLMAMKSKDLEHFRKSRPFISTSLIRICMESNSTSINNAMTNRRDDSRFRSAVFVNTSDLKKLFAVNVREGVALSCPNVPMFPNSDDKVDSMEKSLIEVADREMDSTNIEISQTSNKNQSFSEEVCFENDTLLKDEEAVLTETENSDYRGAIYGLQMINVTSDLSEQVDGDCEKSEIKVENVVEFCDGECTHSLDNDPTPKSSNSDRVLDNSEDIPIDLSCKHIEANKTECSGPESPISQRYKLQHSIKFLACHSPKRSDEEEDVYIVIDISSESYKYKPAAVEAIKIDSNKIADNPSSQGIDESSVLPPKLFKTASGKRKSASAAGNRDELLLSSPNRCRKPETLIAQLNAETSEAEHESSITSPSRSLSNSLIQLNRLSHQISSIVEPTSVKHVECSMATKNRVIVAPLFTTSQPINVVPNQSLVTPISSLTANSNRTVLNASSRASDSVLASYNHPSNLPVNKNYGVSRSHFKPLSTVEKFQENEPFATHGPSQPIQSMPLRLKSQKPRSSKSRSPSNVGKLQENMAISSAPAQAFVYQKPPDTMPIQSIKRSILQRTSLLPDRPPSANFGSSPNVEKLQGNLPISLDAAQPFVHQKPPDSISTQSSPSSISNVPPRPPSLPQMPPSSSSRMPPSSSSPRMPPSSSKMPPSSNFWSSPNVDKFQGSLPISSVAAQPLVLHKPPNYMPIQPVPNSLPQCRSPQNFKPSSNVEELPGCMPMSSIADQPLVHQKPPDTMPIPFIPSSLSQRPPFHFQPQNYNCNSTCIPQINFNDSNHFDPRMPPFNSYDQFYKDGFLNCHNFMDTHQFQYQNLGWPNSQQQLSASNSNVNFEQQWYPVSPVMASNITFQPGFNSFNPNTGLSNSQFIPSSNVQQFYPDRFSGNQINFSSVLTSPITPGLPPNNSENLSETCRSSSSDTSHHSLPGIRDDCNPADMDIE